MTILKYPHSDQCPCCGRVGKAVGSIADGIVETDSSGYVSGSGLMVGTGGLGIGIGGGTVDMRSTSASRLQKNLGRPKDKESETMSGKFYMALCNFVYFYVFITYRDFFQNLIIKGLLIPEHLAKMFFWSLVVCLGLASLLLYRSFSNENKEVNEINDIRRTQLKGYYPYLRYCESCHVVYDPEGYAMGVQEEVVEQMAQRAGIFGGRPACHERKVNQRLG